MGGLECVGGGKLKNSGVMVMKENRLRHYCPLKIANRSLK